ncbi:MAG: SMP-30/gluconolactonase/LRE family protein [Balneolaceae bacterium]
MMNLSLYFLLIAAVAWTATGCETPDGYPEIGSLEKNSDSFEELVPADATIQKLAESFSWTEGPIWRKSEDYLLFTDIPRNTIYRWSEEEGLSPFLRPAGFTETGPPGRELGSNGLIFDSEDRLVMADHGNRRVARLDEGIFVKETLADRFEGNRFNSPNDLIYHSNGDLYFTDPPYGLEGLQNSPVKELDFSGVYRLTPSGELTLLTDELGFPNGIVFSPDEQTLYVSQSDPNRAIWMAYDLQNDGSIENGRVLFDATPLVEEGLPGLPDGMAVDRHGNLFATGPGGVLVLSPEGEHLGTILTGEPTSNCTFGDDGSTLYITSNMNLLRIRLSTTGLGF